MWSFLHTFSLWKLTAPSKSVKACVLHSCFIASFQLWLNKKTFPVTSGHLLFRVALQFVEFNAVQLLELLVAELTGEVIKCLRNVFLHVPVQGCALAALVATDFTLEGGFSCMGPPVDLQMILALEWFPTRLADEIPDAWVDDHVTVQVVRQVEFLPAAGVRADLSPPFPVN